MSFSTRYKSLKSGDRFAFGMFGVALDPSCQIRGSKFWECKKIPTESTGKKKRACILKTSIAAHSWVQWKYKLEDVFSMVKNGGYIPAIAIDSLPEGTPLKFENGT